MSYAANTFAASIPENYDRYFGPVLFEPYAIELARRLPAGATRVLETACGTGRLTRHVLGKLATSAQLIATDLNQPMVDRAMQYVGADPRVSWRAADAQALPVGDGELDAVLCQFGLMFVPDKPLALREARRVLRPGGTLLVAVWDALERNPASALLHEMAMALMPDNPAAFMATPFSMADKTGLGDLFGSAGFASYQIETVVKTGESPSAADQATGFVRGNPLWNQLTERALDAALFERSVAAALAERFGDRPCRSQLSAHVITAIA